MAEGDPIAGGMSPALAPDTEPAPLAAHLEADASGAYAPSPSWMDGTVAPPRVRTGVTPNPRSGLQGALFIFGLVAFVGVAGLVGVSLWGPEKPVASRNHFASDPPLATTASAPPPEATADPAASAAAEPAPAESAAPATPAAKKRRRAPPKGSGR